MSAPSPKYLPVPYGAVWPPATEPNSAEHLPQFAPAAQTPPPQFSPAPTPMLVPTPTSYLSAPAPAPLPIPASRNARRRSSVKAHKQEFNWKIPDFAAFANECDPELCVKYPLLKTIEIGKKFPLYALNARILEHTYGVDRPGDRRHLAVHILQRLFTVELYTEDNFKNIDYIFWNEKEERLNKDWGLSNSELDAEIESIEDFKLLYFFRINDMNALSPFMRRAVRSSIGDDDPREGLKSNQLNSNGMVGVLAGLILAAILPLATNKDVGIFATDFSQIAIITSSICTCFTFLIIVYSADNIIRLNECPTDKVLNFVCAAFDRRTMADRKFWTSGLAAVGYLLNLFCDYLYLLLLAVILVGTALWNWIGVYSQQYADETYRTYIESANQNITEMERFYKIDQKPPARMKNVNSQFLAIAISVMILVGLLIARCAWLKVLSGVVADIEADDPDKNVQAKKDAKEEEKEEEFKKEANFGLASRAQYARNQTWRRLWLVYLILGAIWAGVSIWALWDCAFWYKDYWTKCCLVGTHSASMTMTKRL